jgi:hypothetical protein
MQTAQDLAREAAIAAFNQIPATPRFPTMSLEGRTIGTVGVGIILTFVNERMIDGYMETQDGFEAEIHFDLDTTYEGMPDLETDVVLQILNDATECDAALADLSDLEKISVSYTGLDDNPHASHPNFARIMEGLCRNNGKYFFQPKRRGDPEKTIIARTDGIVGSRGRTRRRRAA